MNANQTKSEERRLWVCMYKAKDWQLAVREKDKIRIVYTHCLCFDHKNIYSLWMAFETSPHTTNGTNTHSHHIGSNRRLLSHSLSLDNYYGRTWMFFSLSRSRLSHSILCRLGFSSCVLYKWSKLKDSSSKSGCEVERKRKRGWERESESGREKTNFLLTRTKRTR